MLRFRVELKRCLGELKPLRKVRAFQISRGVCEIEPRAQPHVGEVFTHRTCTSDSKPRVSICVLQGKVHLELRLSEVITDSGVINHKLATR